VISETTVVVVRRRRRRRRKKMRRKMMEITITIFVMKVLPTNHLPY
jgi:predicted nucleic acid-binding Zn ribbon protein